MARKLTEDLGFAQNGHKIVTGTTAISVTEETYYGVQFVTDCTPTTLTIDNGDGTYSGIKYPAGFTLFGDIRAITAAAGESYILLKV